MAFSFVAKDIHWVYSPKTGAVPFIINKNQDKAKQLLDNVVVEISKRHTCSNPQTAAKNAFCEHYKQDMAYVNLTAIFAHVSFVQNLQHFGFQELYEQTSLSMDQIKFLSENYTKKIAKTHKKEAAEQEKKKQYEAEKDKIFDF